MSNKAADPTDYSAAALPAAALLATARPAAALLATVRPTAAIPSASADLSVTAVAEVGAAPSAASALFAATARPAAALPTAAIPTAVFPAAAAAPSASAALSATAVAAVCAAPSAASALFAATVTAVTVQPDFTSTIQMNLRDIFCENVSVYCSYKACQVGAVKHNHKYLFKIGNQHFCHFQSHELFLARVFTDSYPSMCDNLQFYEIVDISRTKSTSFYVDAEKVFESNSDADDEASSAEDFKKFDKEFFFRLVDLLKHALSPVFGNKINFMTVTRASRDMYTQATNQKSAKLAFKSSFHIIFYEIQLATYEEIVALKETCSIFMSGALKDVGMDFAVYNKVQAFRFLMHLYNNFIVMYQSIISILGQHIPEKVEKGPLQGLFHGTTVNGVSLSSKTHPLRMNG